jgi:tetratricopeptide (TPR) repeat protein/DNA-binding CsgD family transcriptional regulator
MRQAIHLCCGFILCFGWLPATAQNQAIIDSLRQVVSSSLPDTTKVIALGELSWEYHFHDKEKALDYARRELELAQKHHFLKGIGLGHMDMGVTYAYHGEYPKAIDHYQEALPYFEQANKPALVALMHYNTAVAYSRFEASEKAIEYFLKAVDLLEAQQDWGNLSQSYTGIANSYGTLKQFPKAIAYHRKAVQVAEDHADQEMLAVALSDFSATYNALFDTYHQPAYLDSALSYLNQVHAMLDAGKIENPVMRPSVTHNLGNIYFQQEKYEQALPYIQQALVLAEPINLLTVVAQGNTILGKIYTRQKNYPLALTHFRQALPVARQTNPQLAADTYEGLLTWAAEQGKHQEAFNYQREWIALKDSIYNIEKAAMAEKLGLQYETGKKEARIASLEQENDFTRKRNALYLALAGMGLLLSGIIFYLLRLKGKVFAQKEKLLEDAREKAQLRQALAEKQREKLAEELHLQNTVNELKAEQFRQEIAHKERELTTHVLLLEQHNSFLQQVKDQLSTVLPQANGLEPELRKVCRLIDNQLVSEQEFEKFVVHFEKVHPDFFSRLEAVATAALTPADRKFCAYIRMNLSTKEMAQLLNVEPKSIQMARYRLKQKLNLPEDTDLINFIQQL